MTYQVKELLREDGESPFAAWFGSLEGVTERQQQDIDQEGYKRHGINPQRREVTWP
jgi:hypothetical protein